ncbi:MAG TPA: ABC transporter substrate-binding protein [Candidatus Binatia bacterium]
MKTILFALAAFGLMNVDAAELSAAVSPETAPAAHSEEVRRLIAAAKESGESAFELSWSQTLLGGSEGAKKFDALFQRMYGVRLKLQFTPGPSMTDMAGKITQEVTAGRRPSTDILLGTESHFGALLERKILEEYAYARLSPRVRKEFVTPNNIGVEIATILSGVTYNSGLVRPADLPRKLEDLLQPRWKGKIASTQNAAIFDRIAYRPEWSVEKITAFIRRLSEQVGGLIRASENERIISGEFHMLALDGGGHQVRRQQAHGAPLGHTIPENAATVAFLHLGVPRGAAHPNLAKLFINMALTDEGQKVVFATHFTDHHSLPGSQSAAALKELTARGVDPLRVDVKFVTEHPEIGKLSDELRKILRVR